MALIGLLAGVFRLSRRDVRLLLSDLLGVRISLGALSESEERVSTAIAVPAEEARRFVNEQASKHVDATSWRQAGAGRTLWTLATALVTVFGITTDASRAGLRAFLDTVKGILISDRGTQFGFWAMQDRQICWAHLIRKFVAFAECRGPAGELGGALLFWSRAAIQDWHRVCDGALSRREFRRIMATIRSNVENLIEQGVRLGVRGVSGPCANILEHRQALWTFVDQEGITPTNNEAERSLRCFVLWRKTSYGSQSERGDLFAARIMTVSQTLRKQGRHVLSYLTEACTASLTNRTPPSLLPALATP
jgi:transposase